MAGTVNHSGLELRAGAKAAMRTPVEEQVGFELFAGPGGMSEGLKRAGFTPSLMTGFEIDEDACDTAQKMGHPRVLGDLSLLDPYEMARQYGVPHYLHASAPCPGFSASGLGLGRKDTDVILQAVKDLYDGLNPDRVVQWLKAQAQHPMSYLCLEPLRWIIRLQPQSVSFEQVPPVLVLWQAIGRLLEKWGYSVAVFNMKAEQFGVAQTRKRAILLASRVRTVAEPLPTHSQFHSRNPMHVDPGVIPWVSQAEAVGWGMTRRPYLTIAAGTAAGGADPQMIGGSGARATIRKEREEGFWIEKGVGFPRRYDGGSGGVVLINGEEYRARDLRMQGQPAFTITEKARSWMRFDIEHHDDVMKARDAVRLPIEDAALLQSFPPDYAWQGSRTSQFQQIGNAVPPLMGEAIARQLVG